MDSIPPRAVTVYCGSSLGNQQAFRSAAESLGKALAKSERPLVYGGGSKGLMGIVSNAVLTCGGSVTGVIPSAMLAAGGESSMGKTQDEAGRMVLPAVNCGNAEVVIVDSMHERKVEMAKRACAFIGLPGGYGTFEEILEVVTWTQLRIHKKPVLVLNVRKFFEPLKTLIHLSIESGFIQRQNADLLIFVDGPEDRSLHDTFDWGSEAIKLMESWTAPSWNGFGFDWNINDGKRVSTPNSDGKLNLI